MKLYIHNEDNRNAVISREQLVLDTNYDVQTQLITRNSSGDEIAKRDFSVYLFIVQLYINSCCIVNK